MNYQQTIEYLYSQLPMFSKVGASALKNDLLNIRELCGILEHPETKFPSVHIAGTNGKGSTSHMLSAILQQAGYKTGLYTSPHLHDFRERIRINGAMIPEEVVTQFVQRMQPALDIIQPSFFEVTVAIAFEYFAEEKVDIAIIETGLGGRLDSTNIITPILSVITNISYDHMNILGDTLPLIAYEKAGIIKPDVPVVISETQEEVKHVFTETADLRHAPIRFADQDWQIIHDEPGVALLQVTAKDLLSGALYPLVLDLPGRYQERNILGVLTAIQILQQIGWKISPEHISTALSKVKQLTGLGGRWEVVKEHPYTVLDVGHNEAGIRAILEQLALVQYKRLHIVIGFVKDKDVAAALKQLPAHATYYFTKAQIPRALPETDLLQIAHTTGLQGNAYPDVPTAYKAAQQHAAPDDMVLVCGSVFIVGEVPL
ncbi:bifunctional folylpolyglutamate synthase/dihydrofolate synthase [Chitinophaga sp. SYP-B3965]|uniref:bifunctional folylpolyglutamate synthase/dihydrofolate synthase n=1 Tax=Chitinophaga sp. SYP-B3965 TaxID=2663120 RepID=UPI001299E9CD|nr:folylpolyglutamate synthase/dihydrofolate synthase family protein [Chitinophaga sp. SYP-B3965]MRG44002.1 bifunctional folylpolyglutamate synthase/dihydrofolate synthase [Chitinophaga sp. SYP-B3965]